MQTCKKKDTSQYTSAFDRSQVFWPPKPISEEGGFVQHPGRQAIPVVHQRPVPFIEDVEGTTGADNELAEKLRRRQCLNQVEPGEASQEEPQRNRPKYTSNMDNAGAELREKLQRRRFMSESNMHRMKERKNKSDDCLNNTKKM